MHADAGVNGTETIVTYDPAAKRGREEIVEEIRTKLKEEFPGAATEVEQPLSHLLSHLLSGVNAQVAIKIYGPDLDVLRRTADEVEAAVKPIAGVIPGLFWSLSKKEAERLAALPHPVDKTAAEMAEEFGGTPSPTVPPKGIPIEGGVAHA